MFLSSYLWKGVDLMRIGGRLSCFSCDVFRLMIQFRSYGLDHMLCELACDVFRNIRCEIRASLKGPRDTFPARSRGQNDIIS